MINSNESYKMRSQLINYSFGNRELTELKRVLGESEIGMCLGLIYHMKRNDVVTLMRYLHDSTDTCIFSSPVKNDGRSVDWVVSYEEIDQMLEEAGFSSKKVLLDVGDQEADWSWMTNTYYFQAIK